MEEFFLEYRLTIICSIIIFVWFIFAKPKFEKYIAENPFGEYEQPRTAATLGVFFTFIGVTLGLFDFNPAPEAMQESVTTLLGGMRSAFFTSILGMGLSMYLKNIQANAQKDFPNSEINNEATISDLITYLQKSEKEKSETAQILLYSIENLTASLAKFDKSEHEEKILAALDKLTTSLVGDGDYTVIGQMKTLRLEMRDSNDKIMYALQDFYKTFAENNQQLADIHSEIQSNNEKILREFQEFGKTLAENNSKAFIEALNETMKDFNQKLTEQFGENFKQLNVAVGQLLDWQINYIKTVETTTQNLETAFTGIDDAKNSLAQISNSSAAIQNSAQNIQNLIVTANIYEKKLEQVLSEVGTLGDSAKNSVPQIINFVKTSCNEIEKSAETAADNIEDLTAEMITATNQAKNNLVNLSKTSCDEISKTTAAAANNVNNISEKVTAAIDKVQEYAETISDISSDSISELENFANQAVKSMSEVSKKIEITSYQQREIMDSEVKSTKDYVQKIIANLNNENSRVTKTISDSLNNMMKTNNENLQKSTENLNKNLEKVLKESLEKFGDTMYKVSAKFVNDYTPLTQKLANLINIAKDVERRAYR